MLGEPCDRVKGAGKAGKKCLTLGSEFQPIGPAPEQLIAEALLQEPHHVAYCRLGNVQFLGRGLEAAQPSGRLEGTQTIQGRQLPGHDRPQIKVGLSMN